jgi:hypothetical protein
MSSVRHALLLGTLLGAALAPSTSRAQSSPAEPPSGGAELEEEAPPPPVVLRAIPPRYSWDFAFQVSYGQVPLYPDAQPYVGFGLRGGWGKHFGKHRLGIVVDLTMEGPVTVQWVHALEPGFSWEYVHAKGLYLGAGVGPTLALGVSLKHTQQYAVDFDVGPYASFRIGYSQPYSLVARRFVVAVEPKVRWLNGEFTGLVSIVLGSGRGY